MDSLFFFNTVDQDVRYTAVSSFIFLRFFAPAILSPNLFHLLPHHPVSPPLQGNTCFWAARLNCIYYQWGIHTGEVVTLCHFVLSGPSDLSNPHSYLQDHPDARKSRQVQICECLILLSWNHFQLFDDSGGFFPVCVTLLCLSRPISKSLTWPHFTTTSMSRNTLTLWRMWVCLSLFVHKMPCIFLINDKNLKIAADIKT